MTAEVNSAAAAVGCPHHAAAAKSQEPSGAKSDTPCGFSAQMMAAAQQTGDKSRGFRVHDSEPRLSTARAVSSIPKSDFTPAHQSAAAGHWEYPSEEMYFRAMQRKGWDPDAEQMKTIVAIHNTVNEQSWNEVMKWEALHPSQAPPKLKRFIGKPTEYSPKARMMNLFGWSVLPFDRHDWVVERESGDEVRYVIDFYSGQPEPGRPLSVYLDVRPALDSVEGAVDRLRWQFNEKIRPLLPFQGLFFGADTSSAPRTTGTPATADSAERGRSNVTPKGPAN
ncbi:hypothetical protein PybrP1_011251 [[Pythium] brassicae (nom. inval.)]|nr:hypothetical protein PybrP1_011251 [[Pythium] brassicae (nom. inval.)]